MPRQKSNINMAEPLRFWRSRKGYSQLKLAELAQTSALTISQLEAGKRQARGATMDKIIGGLGLTRDEFFNMRESSAITAPADPTTSTQVLQGTSIESKLPQTGKEAPNVRLSNLDLELLNRILNLNFDEKLECLRFLQNL